MCPQQSLQFCDTVGELTWCFAFVFALVRFSKSRYRLFILSKGKAKKHRKDLWDVFLGSGGRLWKAKVLALFSSMVIHGLLVTCFRSLAFAFKLFEMVLCVCGFENVLKKMPCLGNLCNDSCLNIYKGVCLFEKIFQCFESCFEICFEVVLWSVFENWQGCFARFLIK